LSRLPDNPSAPLPAHWQRWRRHLLGIVAGALLLGGVGLWIWPPESTQLALLHGVCIKAGLTLGMLWLALPQVERLPPWLVVTVLLAALVVIIRPQILPALLPRLVALAPLLVLAWVLWKLKPTAAKSRHREKDSASGRR
jgi:hypothetical protein